MDYFTVPVCFMGELLSHSIGKMPVEDDTWLMSSLVGVGPGGRWVWYEQDPCQLADVSMYTHSRSHLTMTGINVRVSYSSLREDEIEFVRQELRRLLEENR